MRKLLMVIAVLLTVGFLSGWVFAGSRRSTDVRQRTRISARRPGSNRSHQTYVTTPFVGVNRRYYRRRRHDHDRAFRVLPHSYYYGYSYPRYVVPQQYYVVPQQYYYYSYPQSGIYFYWSW